MIDINEIYNGNCLDLIKTLPDNSIDLTITSPPYDKLRDYGGIIWNEDVWKEIIKELYRVTKIGSVVVWVVGDATIKGSESGTSFKQALWAKECGFNLHDTMIYQKETPMPQFKFRYTSAFEYMFVFSKGKPLKGTLIEVPSKSGGRADKNYRGQRNANGKYTSKTIKTIKSTKIKSNIWIFSQNNDIDKSLNHPAQFPKQLVIDHIVSWSNKDDLVLDPFMGSGTTAISCIKMKRNFIGFEINKSYCDIANNRIINEQKEQT